MLSPQALFKGLVSRVLPSANADSQNNDISVRLKRYGDLVDPASYAKHTIADEGAYFVGGIAAGGAAPVYAVNASFSATAAALEIQNNDSASNPNAKRIYLDYIRVILGTTAPASATAGLQAIVLDNINRVPTANSTTFTPIGTNMDLLNQTSVAKMYGFSGGTMTVPAASAQARTFPAVQVRSAIPVSGDKFVFVFGADTFPVASPLGGTTAGVQAGYHAPIIIGPGETALYYLWFPGNATTAATFVSYDCGWWER